MKNLVSSISLLLIITSFSSCKSVNYMKEENLSKVKNIPFQEKDYPNTDKEFFTIQNVRGSNMNINRNRALMAAKTVLANQIQFGIGSIAEQELSFEDSNQREAFEQNVEHFVMPSCTIMYKPSSTPLLESDFDESDDIFPTYYGAGNTKLSRLRAGRDRHLG